MEDLDLVDSVGKLFTKVALCTKLLHEAKVCGSFFL